VIRSVREGAAEIGILWDMSDLSELTSIPYRRDRLCLATPMQHSLGKRKRISFAEALEHVTVAAAPGGMLDLLLRREAAHLGKMLVSRIQVSSLDAATRMVAAGLGLAVLPREAVQTYAAASRINLIPLTDLWAERQFAICHKADGSLTATTRLLVEALRNTSAGNSR
ncbi:MAG: LysR substrate-binding domain-containing protein, partial [Burkholderiaceae bacterium]